jgi:hypothetical protein
LNNASESSRPVQSQENSNMSATMGVAIEGAKQSFECLIDYAILPAVRQKSLAAAICLPTIRQTAITAVFCLQQAPAWGCHIQGAWNIGQTHQARLTMAISTSHNGVPPDPRTSSSTPARGGPRKLQRPKSARPRDNINTAGGLKTIEEFHSKRSYVESSKAGRSAPRVNQRQPIIAGSPAKRIKSG